MEGSSQKNPIVFDGKNPDVSLEVEVRTRGDQEGNIPQLVIYDPNEGKNIINKTMKHAQFIWNHGLNGPDDNIKKLGHIEKTRNDIIDKHQLKDLFMQLLSTLSDLEKKGKESVDEMPIMSDLFNSGGSQQQEAVIETLKQQNAELQKLLDDCSASKSLLDERLQQDVNKISTAAGSVSGSMNYTPEMELLISLFRNLLDFFDLKLLRDTELGNNIHENVDFFESQQTEIENNNTINEENIQNARQRIYQIVSLLQQNILGFIEHGNIKTLHQMFLDIKNANTPEGREMKEEILNKFLAKLDISEDSIASPLIVQIEKAQQQIRSLNEEKQQNQDDIDRLNEELAELGAKNLQLEGNAEMIMKQMDDEHRSIEQNMEQKNQRISQLISTLEKQNEELRTRIGELQEESINTNQKGEAVVTEQNEKIHQLNEERKRNNKEILELRHGLERMRAEMTGEQEKFQHEKQNLEDNLQRLRNEIENLRAQIRGKRLELESQKTERETEKSEFNSKLEKEDFEKESLLRQLKEEKIKIREEYNISQTELRESRNQLDALIAEQKTLKEKLEQKKIEFDGLRIKLDICMQEKEEIKQGLNTKVGEVDLATQDIEKLNSELESLRNTNIRLEENLTVTNEKVRSVTEEFDRRKKSYEEVNKSSENKIIQMERNYGSQIEALKTKKDSAIMEKESLEAQLRNNNDRIRSLEGKLQSQREDITKEQNKNIQLETELQGSQNSEAQNAESIANLEIKEKELQGNLVSLRRELGNIRNELEIKNREFEEQNNTHLRQLGIIQEMQEKIKVKDEEIIRLKKEKETIAGVSKIQAHEQSSIINTQLQEIESLKRELVQKQTMERQLTLESKNASECRLQVDELKSRNGELEESIVREQSNIEESVQRLERFTTMEIDIKRLLGEFLEQGQKVEHEINSEKIQTLRGLLEEARDVKNIVEQQRLKILEMEETITRQAVELEAFRNENQKLRVLNVGLEEKKELFSHSILEQLDAVIEELKGNIEELDLDSSSGVGSSDINVLLDNVMETAKEIGRD